MAEHLYTTPSPEDNQKWFQKFFNEIKDIAKGKKEHNNVLEDLKQVTIF